MIGVDALKLKSLKNPKNASKHALKFIVLNTEFNAPVSSRPKMYSYYEIHVSEYNSHSHYYTRMCSPNK